MSTTQIIYLDENNNEVAVGTRRATTLVTLRKTLILIGSVALVATIGLVGVAAYGKGGSPSNGAPELQEILPSSASEEKGNGEKKITVEYVRSVAKSLGSIPPNNLEALDQAGEICYTPGCLAAALNLLNSINFSVNPCDDFFQFSCGRWLHNNPVPPSSSRWSQFNFLRDEVNLVTQGILTAPKDEADAKPINQVKDLYAACIDTDSLEEKGLSPLRDILKEFGDWHLLIPGTWDETGFDWVKAVGELRRRFLSNVIFNVYVDQDLKSADEHIIYLDQPALVLPRDMLINEGGAYNAQLAAYRKYVTDVANELAAADPDTPTPDPTELDALVVALVEFEQEIAKITTADEERSDYDRMYNKFALDTYQSNLDPLNPSFQFQALVEAVFFTSGVTILANEPIVVSETEYVEKLIPIINATPKSTISNYIGFRLLAALGSETTAAMRTHAFNFNRVLTGASEPPTRNKTCADGANNGLGMAIGVKYVEQKFDEAAKTEVNELVEDLRVAFKELLVETTWMDDETRAKADAKANLMKSFMAYPDWLADKAEVEKYFDGLDIVEGNHFENAENLARWSGDKTLRTLREAVDRTTWLTYPGVVNAFYAPTFNSITFPAGILQAPFFKSGYPSFLNYGGIGVVIGHEITHGFDNSGRQFDELGNAENWWSDATSEEYESKAKCIEDQYSSYKVDVDGTEMSVNGLLTLGENIADNGGLREAYIAYNKFVADNGEEMRLPGLEQFEPQQLFFMGYSNIWCENITPAGLRNQLLTDPHSPASFRVKGPLTNNEDFSTKWRCPVGSGMNPDPTKRCILW